MSLLLVVAVSLLCCWLVCVAFATHSRLIALSALLILVVLMVLNRSFFLLSDYDSMSAMHCSIRAGLQHSLRHAPSSSSPLSSYHHHFIIIISSYHHHISSSYHHHHPNGLSSHPQCADLWLQKCCLSWCTPPPATYIQRLS